MGISASLISWQMQYQYSPIILTGGIATAQGSGLPIIVLTGATPVQVGGAINLPYGIPALSTAGIGVPAQPTNPPDYFATFEPLPGSTLIQQQPAMYPSANQYIAANAVITQPLACSFLMTCPAGRTGGMQDRQTTIINLQSKLAQHNSLGGLYNCFTPSFIYEDCILVAMTDVSGGDSKQVQFRWRLDFVQPLVSLQQIQAAQSSLMQQYTNGTPITAQPTYPGGLPNSVPVTSYLGSLGPAPSGVGPLLGTE